MDSFLASIVNMLSQIDPVAFAIGPIAVRWYGLAYIVGVLVALWLLAKFAHRYKLEFTADDLATIVLGAILGILIGGRLGYCLFYGGAFYWTHPLEVFALWDGGMSFHGGAIGALIAGAIVARTIHVPFLTLFDLGAIGAPVGFGLGRLANFFNQELWGRVSNVPWAVVFEGAGPLRRHPSQLYEALLEGVVLLVVMIVLAYRWPPRPRGELIGWLLGLYGLIRIFVEFFREPDTSPGFIAGNWVTMGMILSVPMVIAGVLLVVWARKRNLPHERSIS